jgi:hypothetical protein
MFSFLGAAANRPPPGRKELTLPISATSSRDTLNAILAQIDRQVTFIVSRKGDVLRELRAFQLDGSKQDDIYGKFQICRADGL